MYCLYASDYGPADPAFDPFVGNGHLLQGFGSHVSELATARNFAQLQAMERQLQRGQEIAWCDQGYGWAYRQPVNDFFIVAMIAVVLPYVVLRLVPRIGAVLRRAPGVDFTAIAATRFNRPGDAS
jgi:hypothetical protein